MKIKEEFLDLTVSCPFTGKHTWLRGLKKEMYIHFYNGGYAYIFEEIKENKKK